MLPNIVRSAVIGLVVGILPGAGGDIGGWVSYNEAKRFSKNKRLFGKGAVEAIWASETANNAVTGGAFIPTLTLGIPGSSAAAVLLGGLMIQGLTPGHTLFSEKADITYAIIFGFLIANILMGLVGFLIAKQVVKVVTVPYGILAPIIIVLSAVGSYAINLSLFDVYVMAAFGFLGYFLRKFGFPTAPVVLAIILGPMAELGFKRAAVMAKGAPILGYYLSRPLSLILIVLVILSLFAPFFMNRLQKRMAAPTVKESGGDENSDD